jgi:beta-phosphoglucomutase-like phosphatase (HAD superfamily)
VQLLCGLSDQHMQDSTKVQDPPELAQVLKAVKELGRAMCTATSRRRLWATYEAHKRPRVRALTALKSGGNLSKDKKY